MTDIDEAKVISAFWHKSKFHFEISWKKYRILGLPCCSTRKDLSIDVSITIVGLILTKLWWFLFSGYGQMDRQTNRHGFRILIWKHVGTQKISTQNSKLVVSCRSLYASPRKGMHNKIPSGIWGVGWSSPPRPSKTSAYRLREYWTHCIVAQLIFVPIDLQANCFEPLQ